MAWLLLKLEPIFYPSYAFFSASFNPPSSQFDRKVLDIPRFAPFIAAGYFVAHSGEWPLYVIVFFFLVAIFSMISQFVTHLLF